jgi:hypothetical protein
MNQAVFSWILVALFGLGAYLLAQLGLDSLVDLLGGFIGLLRRRYQPLALRHLKALQEQAGVQPEASKESRRKATLLGLLQWRPFWITAALLAALVLADSLRSPLVLAVVLTGGELYRSASRSRRQQRLNEDAGSLVVQFASRYPITRSLGKTLKDVLNALPSGEVRSAVEDCLARLQMNQPPSEALRRMKALDYPALNRFARLLGNVQDTNQDIFMKTLEILRKEVEGRQDLHRQARQSLTLVRSTTRLLQGVAVTALAVASLLTNWRTYFIASPQNWLLFLGMIGVALLSSFYMEAELHQLEV